MHSLQLGRVSPRGLEFVRAATSAPNKLEALGSWQSFWVWMVGEMGAQAVWCPPADHHRGEILQQGFVSSPEQAGQGHEGSHLHDTGICPHLPEGHNGLNPPLPTQRVPVWGTEVPSPSQNPH